MRESDRTEGRIASLLAVARVLRTGIPMEEFLSLLPSDGPRSDADLRSWLAEHPGSATVTGGYVFSSGTKPDAAIVERRERESERRIRETERWFNHELRAFHGLLCFAAVTGSAAFGSANPEDDIDLFIVTRKGALWTFLLAVYILGRLRNPKGIPLCLNYVLDEASAPEEFHSHQHPVFAREALAMKPVFGRDFGSHLLAQAVWIQEYFPRAHLPAVAQSPQENRGGGLLPTLAGACIFPFLATYLQLMGLYRNHRYARRGVEEGVFRTEWGWRKLSYKSRKYDRLLSLYDPRTGTDAGLERDSQGPHTSGGPTPSKGG